MKQTAALPYLFILLLCLIVNLKGSAMHSPGSEITYKSTAIPGVYEITCIYYRNCGDPALCTGSCGAPCTFGLGVMGGDSGYTSINYQTISMTLQNIRDVTNNVKNCPLAKSICNNMGCTIPGSFTPGIERYEFKGTTNLGLTSSIPASCCTIRLVNSICCRGNSNNALSGVSPYYIESTLNRCLLNNLSNSSPVFSNDPLYVACGGEGIIYNNGIIDADNDSLAISFCQTQNGFNSAIQYLPPFSYDKPLPWSGSSTAEFPQGISCNPKTGDVKFTPGNTGGQDFIGLLAFKCEEWRKINGTYQLLGTVRRECNMIILGNCTPNNIPRLVTNPPSPNNPNTPKTDYEVLAGRPFYFNIQAKDTDFFPPTITDTTYLTWNGSLAKYGATFTPAYTGSRLSGPREDLFQFCWTPHDSLISAVPYSFTVNAGDNHCPLNGKISSAFAVKVLPNPLISITQKSIQCNTMTLSYQKGNPNATGIFRWFISKDSNDYTFAGGYDSYAASPNNTVAHNFLKPGKHYFSLIYNTITLITDSVIIPPFNIKDSIVTIPVSCFGKNDGSILSLGLSGTPPYLFKWDRDTAFSPNNFFNHLVSGHYKLMLKDASGCVKVDSIQIGQPLPIRLATSFHHNACDTFGMLQILPTGGLKPYQYSLNNSSLHVRDTFMIGGSGTYRFSVQDSVGCIFNDSINIILPLRFTSTLSKNNISCYNSKDGIVTLAASGGNSEGLYRYRNVTSGQANTTGVFDHLDSGYYQFTIQDDSNCTLLHTEQLMNPQPIIIGPITGDSVVGVNQTSLYGVIHHPGLLYNWVVINGNLLSGQGTSIISVNWNSSGLGLIEVEAFDSGQCSVASTKQVVVGSVGLNELKPYSGVTLFPNPTRNLISISVEHIPENKILTLYDVQGKIVLQQELKHTQQLNLQELPQGMYILKAGDWYGKVIRE